jgi:hypothetical protein
VEEKGERIMPWKEPNHELYVKFLGGKMWELTAPLTFESAYGTFTAPAGTLTDFCSVPKVPFVYEWCGDIGEQCGALHDYLYQTGIVPKDIADRVLYIALVESGIGWKKAAAMYQAVKHFGFGAWNGYRNKTRKQE